jgi:hypothetical protein
MMSSGRKRALCVGIDYAGAEELKGGVADARAWRDFFLERDFDVMTLLDEQATGAAISAAVTDLFRSSSSGDVVVFQFSGHGTTVTDTDGEPGELADEALCGVDWPDGGVLLLDDEIRAAIDAVPETVNVTLFIDACHSAGVAFASGMRSPTRYERARRIVLPPDVEDAIRARRAVKPSAASANGSRNGVLFAACDELEEAFEANDRGVFSVAALDALRSAPPATRHDDLHRAIVKQLPPDASQSPRLIASDVLKMRIALAPFV